LGRFSSLQVAGTSICVLLIAAFSGCGSNPTRATFFPVPASITLTPATNASMDLGTTLTFTGTPHSATGNNITTPISFASSNSAVLTVANNGLACAGTWDSLTAPQICTSGQVGVAQVTATARGVSSPPTTVYVHQHIHHVEVSANPGQNSGDCHVPLNASNSVTQLSKGQTFSYQATAFALASNGLIDITPTVGVFTWQSQNASVATVSTSASGLKPGEVQVTAVTPGITSIFASVSNVNSVPFDFVTCPVQSIALEVTGEAGANIIVPRGTGKSIVPTVIDTQGITITGVPLTWCSSHPTAVSVGGSNCATNTGDSISLTTSQVGGGTVTASCTPPTCNIGLEPARPIYPEQPISVQVTNSTSGTNPTITAFVSSTECDSIDACVSEVVPLTAPNNILGTPASLSATPNSLVFDRQGSKAYLGTNSSLLGTTGLNVLTAGTTSSSAAQFRNVTGKVLTVSPDGKKVLIADSNQVFVVETASNTTASLPIAGATAADFSPDSLKAFIGAGDKIYVYSTVDPLTSIDLGSAVASVSFLPVGAFAYAATSSSMIPIGTCSLLQGTPFATSSTKFLTALPPGAGITLFPQGVQPTINNVLITADSSGITLIGVQATSVGCPDPSTAVTTGPTESFSFSQGTFNPIQLLVSTDGQAAYVVPGDLASILVFNLTSGSPVPIALTGNALPVQASLSTNGTLMYVAASDGQVHVINTQTLLDVQQVPFPFFPNSLQNDLCAGKETPCKPDLIAVKP
jgi:trimeric autotransporter adhesin